MIAHCVLVQTVKQVREKWVIEVLKLLTIVFMRVSSKSKLPLDWTLVLVNMNKRWTKRKKNGQTKYEGTSGDSNRRVHWTDSASASATFVHPLLIRMSNKRDGFICHLQMTTFASGTGNQVYFAQVEVHVQSGGGDATRDEVCLTELSTLVTVVVDSQTHKWPPPAATETTLNILSFIYSSCGRHFYTTATFLLKARTAENLFDSIIKLKQIAIVSCTSP